MTAHNPGKSTQLVLPFLPLAEVMHNDLRGEIEDVLITKITRMHYEVDHPTLGHIRVHRNDGYIRLRIRGGPLTATDRHWRLGAVRSLEPWRKSVVENSKC